MTPPPPHEAAASSWRRRPIFSLSIGVTLGLTMSHNFRAHSGTDGRSDGRKLGTIALFFLKNVLQKQIRKYTTHAHAAKSEWERWINFTDHHAVFK